ncbi:hypothetical protein MTO96_050524 [Rhipicephalus appendiculatus]
MAEGAPTSGGRGPCVSEGQREIVLAFRSNIPSSCRQLSSWGLTSPSPTSDAFGSSWRTRSTPQGQRTRNPTVGRSGGANKYMTPATTLPLSRKCKGERPSHGLGDLSFDIGVYFQEHWKGSGTRPQGAECSN